MSGVIHLHRAILTALLEQARRDPLSECCGLLAGHDGVITRAFAAENAAGDPATSYEIEYEELFRLVRAIRAAKLELLGIYHSHPAGDNRPSARDIERAYYPDAAYFIISARADAARPVRAFSIRDRSVNELDIQVE